MNSEKELRRLGLKVTLPRMKVLEVFRGHTGSHLCAEEVHRLLVQQGHQVGLATVYRVLAQLDEVGAISRQVFDGNKSVYEINNGAHHDHLVCLNCGRVKEFDDNLIEARQREVAATNGYHLAQHNLTLYGYCPDCDREMKN
jgi:Fur family transcriptional regulator, ferric uptake regulator